MLKLTVDDLPLSMDKVYWWLLKYRDNFLLLYETEQKKHRYQLSDGSVVRLPPFNKPNEDQLFLSLYEALEKIADFHKNESYFKSELNGLKQIDVIDPDALVKWIEKNEQIGGDEFVCFLLDYLDYADNAEHLKVFVLNAREFDIYIDKTDFQNTLEFLEIFNKLYWEEDILQKFD